jgi:hypothetical protein
VLQTSHGYWHSAAVSHSIVIYIRCINAYQEVFFRENLLRVGRNKGEVEEAQEEGGDVDEKDQVNPEVRGPLRVTG